MTGTAWWGLLLVLYLVSAYSRDPRLFLFALMLTAATLASVLWSRYSLSELHYRRRLGANRLFFGEETELTTEVYNAKPLPLPWLLVSDVYPDGLTMLTGHLAVSRTISFRRAIVSFLALRWYERVRRTYRVRGDNRGVYRFGPVEIHAGDVFGFRRQFTRIESKDELVVYPKIVPVQALGLAAARPSGDWATPLRVVEDPLRQQGVRPYQPGDNFRHIHWKATARTGDLQTRTFDPGASHSVMLMLDVQTADRPYSTVPDYLELLVSAAASVAVDSLDNGYSVGLVANAGPPQSSAWTLVPPGRHAGKVVEVLDALARLTGFRLTPFARLVSAAGTALPFGSTVVAFSAYVSDELQEALLGLQDLGHPVLLLTVGDERPEVAPQIATQHLGGTDAWQNLAELDLS